MQINISLPQASLLNTYQEIKSYLKQLELAVHHAQKAVESAEKDGIEISGDASVYFNHRLLESIKPIEGEDFEVILEDFGANFFDELQEIELIINL